MVASEDQRHGVLEELPIGKVQDRLGYVFDPQYFRLVLLVVLDLLLIKLNYFVEYGGLGLTDHYDQSLNLVVANLRRLRFGLSNRQF